MDRKLIHSLKNKRLEEGVTPYLSGMSVSDYNAVVDGINASENIHELSKWFEKRPRFQWLADVLLPICERSFA